MTENTSPRWVAGLSNGETLKENEGKCYADQNLSSWARLQQYIKENNLAITSFGLWVGDRHFNLPSNKPKFGGVAPLSYDCHRTWEGNMGEHGMEYIRAEAKYVGFTIQLFVDLNDTNKSWINVINT